MEQSLRKWWEQIKPWLQGDRARRGLIVLGAVGVLLIAVSSWLPKKSTQSPKTTTTEMLAAKAEARLTEIVSHIEGAGNCRVLVTLENGVEYVYATEQKKNSDRREDTDDSATRLTQSDDSETSAILVDTGSGREGLLVTEIQPTVRGVVVVCEGGDREDVRRRITEAVSVAMNLSSKRVYVTKST